MEMVHTIHLPVKNNMSEWAVQENEIRPHEGDESRMDENDELDPVDPLPLSAGRFGWEREVKTSPFSLAGEVEGVKAARFT